MSADTNSKTGVREMFLRTIAVVGLLAVLILGAWGIIVLATSIPHLFERAGNDVSDIIDGDDEQNSVIVTPAPTQPVTPVVTTPTKPVATTPTKPTTPTSSYVPAPTRAALYGLPDLSVQVLSVAPLPGGRTNVQFSVTNVGSNIAQGGWSFNAEFPWDRSTYTYNSPSQQTLYPGDKIVYNLGVETEGGGYSSNRNDDECDTDGYRSWDERDWENWYDDEDCGDEFDCENIDEDDWDNWDDSDWEDWYEDECDEDEYYDNNNRDSRSSDGAITITADPQNRIYEQNESNNEASVRQ